MHRTVSKFVCFAQFGSTHRWMVLMPISSDDLVSVSARPFRVCDWLSNARLSSCLRRNVDETTSCNGNKDNEHDANAPPNLSFKHSRLRRVLHTYMQRCICPSSPATTAISARTCRPWKAVRCSGFTLSVLWSVLVSDPSSTHCGESPSTWWRWRRPKNVFAEGCGTEHRISPQ